MYSINFTVTNKKFFLSLHYNGANNMKKTGFNGYVYDFSVDYAVTDVDDIKDIDKYLMKKNDIV